MQAECTPKLFAFEAVERRSVVAGFDGGAITSDAGALLLGQVDRGLGLIRRFAQCFRDRRDPRYVEHRVETLIGQRVFGLVLGYEDLNDHDELRKDPTLAVLAGKLSPVLRTDCEALAGKSTLNQEHAQSPRAYAEAARVEVSQDRCGQPAAHVVLGTIGFEPIILHEQANRGRTIIEKFEAHSEVGFAVILLTA